MHKERPYNDLPELPPKSEVETKSVLKRAIKANVALQRLDTGTDLIPNPFALYRAILLQEAKASSEIENVVTTSDRLYHALSETRDAERADPATREVLRYNDALLAGFKSVGAGEPIRPSLIIELCSAIKATDIQVRSGDGCHIVNTATGQTVYTPPVGRDRILGLLDNLCQYMYSENQTDPLIKVAVAHYQFEAIHPFPDGNGRTGRVLNILFLVSQEKLSSPILYLSRHILRTKSEYYRLLQGVTERGEWEPWIIYMLEAVARTAALTFDLLIGVRQAMASATEQAAKEMSTGYSRELMELIFSQPYTRIQMVETAGIARRNAASRYLNDLVRIGILERVERGRDALFLNRPLVDALALPE